MNRRCLGFALALSCLVIAPLAAASWRSIGPGGGFVNARPLSAPSAPRTAYVTGQDRSGFFRTDDGGATWRRVEVLSALVPTDLSAVDPRNARSLLGTGVIRNAGRLLASLDGGLHWRVASAGLPLDDNGHVDLAGGVAFDPATTGHLLAGTSRGLFESRDGGGHWAPGGLPGEFVLALGSSPPNELWAASVSGDDEHQVFKVFRSRDGGATWISQGWPQGNPFFLARFRFDPADPSRPFLVDSDGRLFRSTARGWNRLRPADRTSDVTVLSDGTIVAATDRGARRSDDGGRSWTGGGRPTLASLTAVGPREILAIGDLGAWRSADGGEHFAASSRGLDAHLIRTLGATADGTLWAGIQGPGLMRARNGGTDWTREIRGLGFDPAAYPPIPLAFAASPTDPRELYVAFASERGLELARSRDGGTRWGYASIPAVAGSQGNVLLAVDARNPDRIFWVATVTDDRLVSFVWRSEDGGRTWSEPFRFREHEFVLDFIVDPVDPERAYALSTDGLWSSRDGGRSFARASRGLAPGFATGHTLAIDPERHDDLYVAGLFGVYRSRDGGASFRRLGPALPVAGQRGMAVASGGRPLVSSIEHGVQIWHPETGRFESVGPGLPLDVFSSDILVDPKDRETIYAGTFARSVWRLELNE